MGDLLRCAELARTGGLGETNLEANHCFPVPPHATTPAERRYALHAVTRPGWYLAEHSQSVNYFTADGDLSVSHQQERAAARQFGQLPMMVLSSDLFPTAAWRTPDQTAFAAGRWREGQEALARRSAQGRFEVVPGAGHFIQMDRPDAVIEAVRDVLTAARSNASATNSGVR